MNFLSRLRQAAKGLINPSRSSKVIIQHNLLFAAGHTLDSRFEIVKQLGSGQNSSVWLATSNAGPNALKILTDYVTSLQGDVAFELDVLQQVAAAQAAISGNKRRLLQLRDHFRLTEEHGEHLCLVTEPLGTSVLKVQESFDSESKRLPLPLVKRVTRQLLEGLQVLHDQCRTVHTDIKSDNILFRNITSLEDVGTDPSAFDSADIVLVDFGSAVPPNAPHTRLIQPVALRSPEVITGCEWSCKADIWNLGCIVFELITGRHLFRPRKSATWSAEQYHLARIFANFGTKDAPRDVSQRALNFFRRGKHFDTFFNETGLKIAGKVEPMETILRIYNVYTPDLCSFLNSMLQILPDDRLSAKELLSSQWLQ